MTSPTPDALAARAIARIEALATRPAASRAADAPLPDTPGPDAPDPGAPPPGAPATRADAASPAPGPGGMPAGMTGGITGAAGADPAAGRHVVAIAGPPGAGKSTIAEKIRAGLAARGHAAWVVPMDGFHLDNALLRARGLLSRKGAVESFDAAGFCHLVGRIAAGEADIVYPVFDRARDLAVAGAACLPAGPGFVLVEGNYLLLRDAPWNGLAAHWSATIWIDAPLDRLESRLMARWHDAGLPEDQARARVDGNDLENTRLVKARSLPADLDLGAVA